MLLPHWAHCGLQLKKFAHVCPRTIERAMDVEKQINTKERKMNTRLIVISNINIMKKQVIYQIHQSKVKTTLTVRCDAARPIV